MGHKNKTYRKEADERLKSMLCIGRSKHNDKLNGVDRSAKIYSWSTYHSYRKWVDVFLAYCKKTGRPTDLESCQQYVDPWLQSMIDKGLSAWTINLARSSVAKLYGCPASDFLDVPKRKRSAIKRSREAVAMDSRVKDEWGPLVDFCKATGLRRHEIAKLQGSDLRTGDGNPCLEVKGKGGRLRFAPIIGTPEEVQAVVDRCNAAGSRLVWPDLPSKLDIHSYRAYYAQKIYKAAERPSGGLQGHDLYHCRRDRKGEAYDRQALMTVSQALGRVSVVAENYLWGLD